MATPTQLNPHAPTTQKPPTAYRPEAAPRPSVQSIALAKLKEAHPDEYDFYLRRANEDKAVAWADLPDYPVKLQTFCLADYIKAALDRAEYEPDGDVIVATAPGIPGSFTQGETMEEARDNLADAIEGNILIALQMGWEIPPIPGSDVRIDIVEIDTPKSP